MSTLLVLVGSGVGLLVGAAIAARLAAQRTRAARLQAAEWLEQARREAIEIKNNAEQRATRLAAELVRNAQAAYEQESAGLTEYEQALDEREQLIESRELEATTQEAELRPRQESLVQLGEAAHARLADVGTKRTELQAVLEQRSGITATDLIQHVVAEEAARIELDVQRRLRSLEEVVRETSAQESRRVMAVAVDRYNGIGHLERVQNVVPIDHRPTLETLCDTEGAAYKAFVEEVGCELTGDLEGRSVTVRGDDPLARELARRVLRQLAGRAVRGADAMRQVARQLRGELDREVQNAARKAIRMLGVTKLHPDVLNLVGRLKFRLSYSQNQLKHAIEVGYLTGMMAEELGLDVVRARRGGLLHDIGKAMTHDHEGSHAVLGAQVARRCGEEEIVANAIGAHHNDEPAASPIAHLVAAADALSGARPGARRESATNYLNRIDDIQRIAARDRAVRRVDIMHAGREVRVLVAGEDRGEVDSDTRNGGRILRDDELFPLAQDIARDLEAEMTFAGQIRVTVIRESRSVAIAR
ncbi:MAG: Rnase Y domain-containing protein [Myxococcota bacterium]|mgnify:CR=1 FL=1